VYRLLIVGLCAFGILSGAYAQTTRVIVPGPPGGFADVALRLTSDHLRRSLGTAIVIDHRPGAGGAVALDILKDARADGATLGMINLSAAANETLLKKKSFALLTDFDPVGHYAWLANLLIVHPSVPAKNVAALIAAVGRRTDTNYSSGGVGSPGHLIGELFKLRTGLKLTHVAYKGAPPAVTAVLAGEVTLMFATASSAIGQIQSGRLRALAVTTSERLRQLPDVPTLTEAGLRDLNVTDWVGLLVPRGVAAQTRGRLHQAFAAAFADAENQDRLRNATILPAGNPLAPDAFGGFLRAEIEQWGRVIKTARIAQE